MMKKCSRVAFFTAGATLFAPVGVVSLHSQVAQISPVTHTVTVDEGTSMSVAASPDGTQLAIDLQGSIWLLPIGGGQARRLTDSLNDARQPAWSPNGDAIVFQGYRDGQYDIWLVSPADGTLSNLTPDPFDDREPAWSHDGSRVAFSSDRALEGSYDIWILEIRTRQLTRATDNASDEFMPSWSPDDTEIAFATEQSDSRSISVVSLADGSERNLAAPAEGMDVDAPSWGPSGELIYHSLADGESRLMLNGESLTRGENVFPFRVSWLSPTEFLYTADGKIRRRSLADAGPATVEFAARFEVTEPNYSPRVREFGTADPRQVLGIMRPQISPDGETVVFAALGDIWLMSLGEAPVRLTDDRHLDTEPAWSPDGDMIVYASDRAGGFLNLWVRDLRNGEDRQITHLETSAMAPTWSPDGQSIAFLNVDGAWRRANVSVLDVETGVVTRIHETMFGPGTPTWSPDSKFVGFAALVPYSTRFREGLNQILMISVAPDSPQQKWITPLTQQSIDSRAGAGPVWSPDGSRIALIYGGRLAVVPVSSEGDVLGPPTFLTTEIAHLPSWTADSRYILYQSMDRLRLHDLIEGTTSDVPIDLTYSRQVPDGRLLVRAGMLVDGVSPEAQRDVDIWIEGNRIVRIEPRGTTPPGDSEVVDASDLVVMPGLIDFHTHLQTDLGEAHGRAWLSFGVTTVRSPGGTPYEAAEIRESIESGSRLGPRIFSTGYLMEWRRVYYKMAVAIASDEHLAMELQRAGALQHDLVKSYVRMPDRQQRQMVEYAHAVGIPVSSHEVYPATLNGLDGMEHAGGTSRRGYSPKTSTLGRSYSDVATLLGAAKIDFAPTVALSSVWIRALLDKEPTLRDSPRFTLVPEWLRPRLPAPGAAAVFPPEGAGPSGQMIMEARRAGARILASTDSPLPANLHSELLAYVTAGMSPFEALQTATVNPAAALGLPAGSIEPGKLADLVIVEGNPLSDITNTLRVRAVIANGRAFTLDEILAGTR